MAQGTKKRFEYRILITPDTCTGKSTKCFTAYVPVLGIAVDGDSVEEARENAQKLITFHLESLKKEGRQIPLDTEADFITTAKVSV